MKLIVTSKLDIAEHNITITLPEEIKDKNPEEAINAYIESCLSFLSKLSKSHELNELFDLVLDDKDYEKLMIDEVLELFKEYAIKLHQ